MRDPLFLHGVGTVVQVVAHCPAYGMYGVVVGHGDGTDYQVDMNAVHPNCPDHTGACVAGWNGESLRRVWGGRDDRRKPPPIEPAGTIPLSAEIGLTA